jgi:hypothetical protein
MSSVIKVNIINDKNSRSSATISKRVAQAYLLICTKLAPTEENAHLEMQRIANYENFKDQRISNTKVLEDFLLTRIEGKLTIEQSTERR